MHVIPTPNFYDGWINQRGNRGHRDEYICFEFSGCCDSQEQWEEVEEAVECGVEHAVGIRAL